MSTERGEKNYINRDFRERTFSSVVRMAVIKTSSLFPVGSSSPQSSLIVNGI